MGNFERNPSAPEIRFVGVVQVNVFNPANTALVRDGEALGQIWIMIKMKQIENNKTIHHQQQEQQELDDLVPIHSVHPVLHSECKRKLYER